MRRRTKLARVCMPAGDNCGLRGCGSDHSGARKARPCHFSRCGHRYVTTRRLSVGHTLGRQSSHDSILPYLLDIQAIREDTDCAPPVNRVDHNPVGQ